MKTWRLEDYDNQARARIAQGGRSHIIRSLPGKGQTPREGCAAKRRARMLLDVDAIQKILPHRYPFLMVDGILEMERLKRIVGVKNGTINEPYFKGNFPGAPVVPGVWIIESSGNSGGLLELTEVPHLVSKM